MKFGSTKLQGLTVQLQEDRALTTNTPNGSSAAKIVRHKSEMAINKWNSS